MAQIRDHYTAVVTIEEVLKEDNTRSGNLQDPRGKQEVTRIVVKAKTLASLKSKLSAHIAIVDED